VFYRVFRRNGYRFAQRKRVKTRTKAAPSASPKDQRTLAI
jgi:hypothetical protein